MDGDVHHTAPKKPSSKNPSSIDSSQHIETITAASSATRKSQANNTAKYEGAFFLLVYCVFAQELWAAHIEPGEGEGDLAYIHTYIKDERQQHTHVGRLLNSLSPLTFAPRS